jgi:hypothetical protein
VKVDIAEGDTTPEEIHPGWIQLAHSARKSQQRGGYSRGDKQGGIGLGGYTRSGTCGGGGGRYGRVGSAGWRQLGNTAGVIQQEIPQARYMHNREN